jgi:hypothetical protein
MFRMQNEYKLNIANKSFSNVWKSSNIIWDDSSKSQIHE